jgi:hypothetical protein
VKFKTSLFLLGSILWAGAAFANAQVRTGSDHGTNFTQR